MDELKRDTFKQTNLYLDQEVVFLATRKLTQLTGNKRMLSTFVNQMLEEFILEGEALPETSIRQKARELADTIRKDRLSQRQIISDVEAQKAEQEKRESERQALIQKETKSAIQRLKFQREWLRDKPNMSYESKRLALADEVSINCRMDLQWKDLYSVVATAIYEEVQA